MGIDLIPAQPPRGVSTIQGNFLSPLIQNLVKEYLAEVTQRRKEHPSSAPPEGVGDEVTVMERPSYIDTERADSEHEHEHVDISANQGRVVDVSFPFGRIGLSLSFLHCRILRLLFVLSRPDEDHIVRM